MHSTVRWNLNQNGYIQKFGVFIVRILPRIVLSLPPPGKKEHEKAFRLCIYKKQNTFLDKF